MAVQLAGRYAAAQRVLQRVLETSAHSTKSMLVLIEQLYNSEKAFPDSTISQDDFDRMADAVRRAYELIILEVESAAAKVDQRKATAQSENEAALGLAIAQAKVTKAALQQRLKEEAERTKAQEQRNEQLQQVLT